MLGVIFERSLSPSVGLMWSRRLVSYCSWLRGRKVARFCSSHLSGYWRSGMRPCSGASQAPRSMSAHVAARNASASRFVR